MIGAFFWVNCFDNEKSQWFVWQHNSIIMRRSIYILKTQGSTIGHHYLLNFSHELRSLDSSSSKSVLYSRIFFSSNNIYSINLWQVSIKIGKQAMGYPKPCNNLINLPYVFTNPLSKFRYTWETDVSKFMANHNM